MDNNEMEYAEYETFMTTKRDGTEAEMAIVDSFEFEGKKYVASALVVGDEISEEGLFIFEAVGEGEDVSYEKIADADEYSRLAEAYSQME